MDVPNFAALAFFVLVWVFYNPLLVLVGRGRGVVNTDLTVIRAHWTGNISASAGARLMDSQLVGHALNSASFFASSNLLLIAASAGALFGGQRTFESVSALKLVQTGSHLMFEIQLALVLVALARGLLDFIWAIRQINYCLAAMGAMPEPMPEDKQVAYGEAMARILNPALGSFSSGVRGYYFALAAAAWLFGPWAFMGATAFTTGLLMWRQLDSPAARAINDFRKLLDKSGR